MNKFWAGLVTLLVLGLSACEPPTPQPVSYLRATATTRPTSTATVIWFPATATPTSVPTRMLEPTPDQRPAQGSVVIRDTFSDSTLWQTSQSTLGSVAFGKGELSLGIASPKESLFSLRKGTPPPDDFYLSITVSPALCRADDAYGLLVRAATNRDGYRVMLNCRGQIRLERLRGGEVVVLLDWEPSNIPSGAPISFNLGVWAVKNELRVFTNDQFQFSARDPVWTGGQIGLFARSAADTPLAVNFSDLTIRQIDAARLPTATPTPSGSLTPTPRISPTPTLYPPNR